MLKNSSCIFAAGILSLTIAGAAQAAPTEGEATATQGVVRCSFSTFLRQSNTEIHQAFITLRNVDPTEPIFIDRMRLWNARGIVLFDSAVPGGALPPTTGGATLGGPGNNTLSPNQSAQYEAAPIVGLIAAQGDRPGQVEIQWSAGRRGALTLQASTSRVVREHIPNSADPTLVGSIRAERSRSSSSCRSIALR